MRLTTKIFLFVILIPFMTACGRTSLDPEVQRLFGSENIDPLAPIISLSGENPYYVEFGKEGYSEPGFSAISIYNRSLTSRVSVEGTVDLTKVGTYRVTYSVTDPDTGRTTSIVRVIIVRDTSIPELVILEPRAGTYVNARNQASFKVEGECSEKGREIRFVGKNQADGSEQALGSLSCPNSGEWKTALDFSAIADTSALTLRAITSDAQGNQSLKEVSIKKDILPPSLQIDSSGLVQNRDNEVDNPSRNTGNRFVSFSSPDATHVRAIAITGSDCSGRNFASLVELPIDGAFQFSVAANQANTVCAIARDEAGNYMTTALASETLVVDTIAPVVAITSPDAGTETAGAISISGTCTDGDLDVVADGDIKEVQSTSCNGGNFTLTVDLDDSSGDGDKIVSLRQSDAAGNISAVVQRTFKLDKTAPELTVVDERTDDFVNLANRRNVRIGGTCSAIGLRVRATAGGQSESEFCRSGTYSIEMDLSNIGDFPDGQDVTVRLRHADFLGNEVLVELTIPKDVTAPVVSITDPASGTQTTGALMVRGTCDSTGQKVRVFGDIQAENQVDCSASGTYSANVVLQGTSVNGEARVVRVEQVDQAGNRSVPSFRSFILDNQEASVSIVSSASVINADNVQMVRFNGACSESGEAVEIRTGGILIASETCNNSGAYLTSPLDLRSLAEGSHTFVAIHADELNGAVTSDPALTLFKDTIKPVVTLTKPTADFVVNDDNVSTFEVQGSCESANAGDVSIKVNDQTVVADDLSCTGGSFSGTVDLSGIENGNLSIRALQTDNYGNQGESEPPVAGTKDTDDSIEICSRDDFNLIRQNPDGEFHICPGGIDMGVDNFNRIRPTFNGVLDGRGESIRNLRMVYFGDDLIGLFERIGPGGVIRDLQLETVNIYGVDDIGSIAAISEGLIEKVAVVGGVGIQGDDRVGGLVGRNLGSIKDSYTDISVDGFSSSDKVGGLVGLNLGRIETCYSASFVFGDDEPGGLVGDNNSGGTSGTIVNSYWDVDVSEQSNSPGGGTGLSTADAKLQDSYQGFDFINIWMIDEGNDYPRLR